MGRFHCCHPRALVHGSPLLAVGGRNSDRLDIQRMGRAGPLECLLCRRNANARSGPPCGGNLYPRAIRATPARQSHAYLRALGKVAFGTAGGTIEGVVGLLSPRSVPFAHSSACPVCLSGLLVRGQFDTNVVTRAARPLSTTARCKVSTHRPSGPVVGSAYLRACQRRTDVE